MIFFYILIREKDLNFTSRNLSIKDFCCGGEWIVPDWGDDSDEYCTYYDYGSHQCTDAAGNDAACVDFGKLNKEPGTALLLAFNDLLIKIKK